MKTDTTYNGWTNYATWLVNRELFDRVDLDEAVDADALPELADALKELAEEEGYSQALLTDVNWYAIAKHQNERVAS